MKNLTHALKAAADSVRDFGHGDERITQRLILTRLTATASLDPEMYYPSDDDTKCRYCGIRKRLGNLCVECEGRRSRLAVLFPDVPPPMILKRKQRPDGQVEHQTCPPPRNS